MSTLWYGAARTLRPRGLPAPDAYPTDSRPTEELPRLGDSRATAIRSAEPPIVGWFLLSRKCENCRSGGFQRTDASGGNFLCFSSVRTFHQVRLSRE